MDKITEVSNMDDMKDQPLCSDCDSCEVGASAGASPSPDDHTCHTIISPYVLYKTPLAPLANLRYDHHHLQHVPTQITVWTVMFDILVTSMGNILDGWFSSGSHSYVGTSTIIANKHVTDSVECSLKGFLCHHPRSSNKIFKVSMSL
jgi:hypothetical protein